MRAASVDEFFFNFFFALVGVEEAKQGRENPGLAFMKNRVRCCGEICLVGYGLNTPSDLSTGVDMSQGSQHVDNTTCK